MLPKVCAVLLLIAGLCFAKEGLPEWDLAVVINDQIELLQSNGSVIGSTVQQFSKLKALTFDAVRHQFVVSDMDQLNDTIFTVQLTKETDITPIIQDLPDDVQGLTIDPITDTLYWTDSINKTISYINLIEPTRESRIFLSFTEENPQDVVIDVCRRFIYWTNSNINKPTIERSRLDGTQHEVIVDSDLRMPVGIAIDYRSQRLFWGDMREGIYYRIESINLDGKEREIVYEGTHSKPFGVTVDENAVYWTDVNNNAVWKIDKDNSGQSQPELLRNFNERPMGIIAKDSQITKLPDCHNLAEAIKIYNGSKVESFITINEGDTIPTSKCFNGGSDIIQNNSSGCKCPRGFVGKFCEISVCHNFCVYGNCHLSSLGYPQCHCPNGYGGKRCERDMCDGFCLNKGICHYNIHNILPSCSCRQGFVGTRCETSVNDASICELFCKERSNEYLMFQGNEFVCRCERGVSFIFKNNITASEQLSWSNEQQLLNYMQDPIILVMSAIIFIMFFGLVILSTITCQRKRRPRIKKRIIVNKNITPLAYRPQPTTEQCEITIENCCNMNICETPCFEPPQIRGLKHNKNDDKKILLSSMENGEEIY